MNIGDFVIRINNRKVLTGFFNSLNLSDKITDILRIIDKLDKIGLDEVKKELSELGLNDNEITSTFDFINIKGSNGEKIENDYQLNYINYILLHNYH